MQSNLGCNAEVVCDAKVHQKKKADLGRRACMCFSVWKYHKGQEESKGACYGVMSGLIIQSRLRLITQILLGEGEEW